MGQGAQYLWLWRVSLRPVKLVNSSLELLLYCYIPCPTLNKNHLIDLILCKNPHLSRKFEFTILPPPPFSSKKFNISILSFWRKKVFNYLEMTCGIRRLIHRRPFWVTNDIVGYTKDFHQGTQLCSQCWYGHFAHKLVDLLKTTNIEKQYQK